MPLFIDTITGEVLDFVHSAEPAKEGEQIYYPGERTLLIRKANTENGIPVNEAVWKRITEM